VDILVSSPSGGQMLVYNDGSTNKWQNLSKLTLPSFTNSSPVNGDVWYDNSTSFFKFYQNGSTMSLSTFNPTLSSITSGNIIYYNGSNWVNAYLPYQDLVTHHLQQIKYYNITELIL